MSGKTRLDVEMVRRGLAQSRERAQALVMAGQVYIGQEKAQKSSQQISEETELTVRGAEHPYVSRGALKLSKALTVFPVAVDGRVALDVGASTGGFTDVLLQRGASRVYAVDVGYGQLDWKLRSDPRVTTMERCNARRLKPEDFPERPVLAAMDVSFISVLKILPALAEILPKDAPCLTLIKPQFEAGRAQVGKKGVVRDPAVHLAVLQEVTAGAVALGYSAEGLSFSPITGPEGNIEFLLFLRNGGGLSHVSTGVMRDLVTQAHAALRVSPAIDKA